MKRHGFVLFWLFFIPAAWAQTPFYQGKTITVIAGVSAGSAYDLYARLMAQFMGTALACAIESLGSFSCTSVSPC